MEEDKEKQDKFQTEDLKEMVENRLKEFSIEDVNPDNLDILYKLVDIHKDLANEE